LVVNSPAASAERPDFKFLHFPNWVLGRQAMTPGGAIIEEYWPFNQSALNWTEMFTWQYFPDRPGQATPRVIMEDLKRFRMSRNPNTEWKIVSKFKGSIIYEWKVHDEPGVGDYYEIARIMVGADGIYIFHYATKQVSISLHDRREWARTLKKIDLIS
jgi:hypothetical protein